MKVYVLMEEQKRIGRCSDEINEYIVGIYLDKENAKNSAKVELQKKSDLIRWDFKISYYIREWEVE